MTQQKTTYQRIYDVIRQIPKGKVATYGLIAEIEGTCTPRMVGYALSNAKEEMYLPWHRVINRSGKISLKDSEGYALQRLLLEREGVVFTGERVNLREYLWMP
ncbi:MAG: MGMT family protein [Thermotogota bacterium]|nr:MGMT family protein [Thermotogota bacterium]